VRVGALTPEPVGPCLGGGGEPAQIADGDQARTAVRVVQPQLHGMHHEQPDQASRRQEQGQQQQLFSLGPYGWLTVGLS